MSIHEFDAFVEAHREGLRSIVRGDNAPVLDLNSRRDDVTLANPLGPPIVGWANIARESAAVAAAAAEGTKEFEEVTRFATPDLGYIVGFERAQVRRPGSDETVALSLRVTTVFRREENGWMVAHRHADRITTDRRATGSTA